MMNPDTMANTPNASEYNINPAASLLGYAPMLLNYNSLPPRGRGTASSSSTPEYE